MRALLSALLLLFALPLSAHELAQSDARALLRENGTFVIDIKVDPETLVQRLEFAADQELSEKLSASDLQRRIRELEPQLRQNIELQFGGARVQPSISYVPRSVAPGAMWGHIRLEGAYPASAADLQWRYRLLFTAYPLTVAREGSAESPTVWVDGDKASPVIPLGAMTSNAGLSIFREYVVLGFTHILPKGLDHILFVLGIFLLSTRLRPVLMQVTAFTVAHSITLALSMYGLVSLPSSVVEPLIALSIVYVAIENLSTRKLHSWRVAIVFVFGLLHGMGFAGVLRELGLPRGQFVNALVAFNVGVELGQLTVIALAFVAVASWARRREWYRTRVVVPASVCIAAVGLFWTVERIL